MGVLTGSTVLVTGGGIRVGRLLCLTAAKAGAKVIVHYAHSETGAKKVVGEITAFGGEAVAIQQDFSRVSELEHFVNRCWELMPFDILVNNAARFEDLSLQETSLLDWQRHIDVNLTAPFLLSKTFLVKLPADQSGRIINILGWRALRPGEDHFPYTISKAALGALTQSIASVAAPRVQVNGIALGAIALAAQGTARSARRLWHPA